MNFYRRIESYNPEMKLFTWVYVVTKRHVAMLEKRRSKYASHFDANIEDCEQIEETSPPNRSLEYLSNYRNIYSDEVVEALDSIGEDGRRLILLREAGYSMKEIAKMEFERGSLESGNTETIKSRLFVARNKLKEKLKHLERK